MCRTGLTKPARNIFFIDAGGLTLSKDRSTGGHSFDAGFGLIADTAGELLPDLWVSTVHQELGEVGSRSGRAIDLSAYPIGRTLRILPNHSDMTAAAYSVYNVIDNGMLVDRWERVNGW